MLAECLDKSPGRLAKLGKLLIGGLMAMKDDAKT